jgi:hypothetical protein
MLKYLENVDIDMNDLINNPKKVWGYIDRVTESVSTKKLYISAILNELKDLEKPIPKLYNDVMVSLKEKANKKADSQKLTEAQEENAMTWSDILIAYHKFKEEVKKDNIIDYRDFMILSLYILNDPARADYNDMRIYTSSPPKDATGNFMIWTSRKKEFIFQDYKTSTKYGKINVDISKELRKVIKHWLSINPDKDWLMGGELTPSWLSLRIRIIMKRLTGKEVGINILRHARITEYLGDQKSINEKKPLAHNMMHSIAVQEQYKN